MVTEGWFNWIDTLPVWLQVAVAVPIGVLLIAFISLCIFMIQKEVEIIIKILTTFSKK